MTARFLVTIGVFPNMKKANKRLLTLCVRKEIHEIGQAVLDGVWHRVYQRKRCFGSNAVQHNLELTLLKWAFDGYDVQRWKVPHYADLLLTSSQDRFLLEYDRDTENDKRVRERVKTLAEWPDTILWVAPSPRRIRELKRLTTPLGDRCLFTTFDEAQRPHEAVWTYRDGEKASVPPGDR